MADEVTKADSPERSSGTTGSKAIKEAKWWEEFSAPINLGNNMVKDCHMPNDVYMGAYKHSNDYM